MPFAHSTGAAEKILLAILEKPSASTVRLSHTQTGLQIYCLNDKKVFIKPSAIDTGNSHCSAFLILLLSTT